MESTYSIVAALWSTTWLLAQWRIFYPSLMILHEMEPTNITIRWWPAAWIIFGIGSFIFVPVLLFPVIIDKYRDAFVENYVRSLLTERD